MKSRLSREWKNKNRIVVRRYLQEYKIIHGCIKCGEKRSYCLVFHHRDPKTKEFDLSLGRDKAFSSVLSEIKKCDVLCANCHLELHALKRLVEFELETRTKMLEDGWLFSKMMLEYERD